MSSRTVANGATAASTRVANGWFACGRGQQDGLHLGIIGLVKHSQRLGASGSLQLRW